jgi:peptide/nickel transport system substrate-binding protein
MLKRAPLMTLLATWPILALAVVAGGCGGGGVAGSTWQDKNPLPADTMTVPVPEIGRYGGRFVIGQTTGPKTFNPMMANETSTTDVTDGRMFMGLADFDNETQQDIPGIAKSWDVTPDGLTWTWHLRRGGAFSDGHPLTADDIMFSFQVAYDDTLHPSVQDLLKAGGKRFEITKVDSYTVVMKIAAPYAMMVGACGSVYILPRHVLEPAWRSGRFASAYSTSTPPESIVTSGAWQLKQYVPGEKTVLTRNPYWFRVDAQGHRLPYLDELVFLIVPDQNTAALKFQAGEVDALDNVKPEDYKSYTEEQQRRGYTLYSLGPALRTNFFWFNLNTANAKKMPKKKAGTPLVDPVKYAWFIKPEFRRAVSMAIDRDAMIRSVFYGDGIKNWSTTTPGNKKWSTSDIKTWDYDPEQAKKLLAGLGWKDSNGDGFLEDAAGHTISFSLKTNGDNNTRMAMANFVKDDLAKVGIQCNPSGVDFNTLISNIRDDFQYDAVLLGLQSGVPPDPAMGQNVYRSSGITHYWNLKQIKPETPEEARMDALMSANVGTIDMAERHRTWTEIQNIVNDECYIVWLPTLIMKLPVRNRFGNVQPSVIPHTIIWNIERVYVKSPGSRA